ncbi:hypothetical protein PF005_g17788 [Phytophthora fragariae]|uniref:Uncharacterized protein n=1 Tax=Phytophthora fragariae TaxID=53985 RepID=A0A6A3RFF8_9STRA|nr:hypothetical protein PF003_g2901 [Phytophthora fragariae]KAE8932159.1 hypothetical protein PF009_g17810 [Phytophthora fragariae]KAE8996565.1 hypothetical protein PF011_g15853 [Phytophthora fragariae]KAE9096238.1 hypothetical protein PF007_g17077 [Phytophthora fragariae]KAE9096267.1 hypothetical protein PF010_g16410 [Phytophthora fragariae]
MLGAGPASAKNHAALLRGLPAWVCCVYATSQPLTSATSDAIHPPYKNYMIS